MILDIILFCIIAVLVILYYKQDKTVKAQIDYIDRLESNYNTLRNRAQTTVNDMREIDSNGNFEAEDEVGFIFKNLVEIVEKLDDDIESDQ